MAHFGGGALTYLGHSTFHLRTPGGRNLLIDAWVQSNPACPDDKKQVGPLEVILVTHGHTDHAGDLIALARETGAVVVCTPDIASWLGTKGLTNVQTMNVGGTLTVYGLNVTMTRADHASRISDGDGPSLPDTQAVGFVLTLENGATLYAAGDTGLFSDLALIGALYRPDFALLPIGDHYTMGPRQAANACRLLNVPHVIPIHYGTFPFLTGTVEAFAVELGRLELRPEVHALKPGEALA